MSKRKWLTVVPVSIPKSMLASRLTQYLWLQSALLTPPATLNFSSSRASPSPSFSVPYDTAISAMGSSGSLCLLLIYSLSLSVPLSLSSHGLVQSSGPVQCTSFCLCPGLSQMPLTTLSLISTVKSLPSITPCSSHVHTLYRE